MRRKAIVGQMSCGTVGALIVECVGARPGDHLPDVACGTADAGIRAGQAGGSVVGW